MYCRRLRLPLMILLPLVSAVVFISQQANTAVVAVEPVNPFHMGAYDFGLGPLSPGFRDAYTDDEDPFELYDGANGKGWQYHQRNSINDKSTSNGILDDIDDDDENDSEENHNDDDTRNDAGNYRIDNLSKRSSRIHVYRRDCIHRNGRCDTRPNDCCFNTSCRCNLWGNNCRCQRIGLFQKWG